MKKLTIAIDGVAGSGKSTLAKSLAKKLGYLYIDTGAMYRALTYKVISDRIPLAETDRIVLLAGRLNIFLRRTDADISVFADSEDVTEKIRWPEVSAAVSRVSAIAGVREHMVRYQRELGKGGGVVIDGRDIGTVVFPAAEIKFFLTADVDERSKRRYQELAEKGIKSDLNDVEKNIIGRDKKDSSRQVSPLKSAPDAIIIDTTRMTMEEKDALAWKYVQQRL